MKTLAMIPARGGSKRIPRKNIRDFCGRPMMAYPITAALQSGCFDEVMVSTEDEEIAAVARQCKAAVPFLRSGENASDHASTLSVIREVLTRYARIGVHYDFICCIYPATPLLTAQRLGDSMRQFMASECDTAVPVMRFSHPIMRALRIREGRLSMLYPQYAQTRSQDLETLYHDSGQFYCLRAEAAFKIKALLDGNVLPLILDESEAQDIDDEQDWEIAEMKFKMKNRGKI